MHEYLSFARGLARRGGKKLAENFGRLDQGQIENKGTHDLVTALDKELEQFYRQAIREYFPDHGILGEEGTQENTEASYLWIIDPLDGTRNYSIQVPFYATTLCLVKDGQPLVSVINVPAVGKLYSAFRSEGAWLNDKKIHVSSTTELKKASVLYCHTADRRGVETAEKYAARLKLAAFNADRLRSAGAEMGLVAEGLVEAYLLDGLPVWDLAAGALLIREAGGKATDFSDKDWQPGDNRILVSNGSGIHGDILEILTSVL